MKSSSNLKNSNLQDIQNSSLLKGEDFDEETFVPLRNESK